MAVNGGRQRNGKVPRRMRLLEQLPGRLTVGGDLCYGSLAHERVSDRFDLRDSDVNEQTNEQIFTKRDRERRHAYVNCSLVGQRMKHVEPVEDRHKS